jgi:DNA-binding NarL/FixJ family response regulator
LRVLLAVDHGIVRRGLRSLLEEAGHVVVAEAANGLEAVRLAEEHRPELLVLDIGMPRLNGIEVAARSQKLDRPPGVIILSMHADESYIIRALAARGRTLKQGSGHTAQCGIVDRRNTSRESDAEAESAQHGQNRALRRSKGHHRIRRARTVHHVPSIPTRISGPYRMAARDHFPAAFPFGHGRR